MLIQSGLSAGCVLQRRKRGAKTIIHGTTRDDGTVVARVSRKGHFLPTFRRQAIGRARGGRFVATLAGLPAGGPYTIRLECGSDAMEIVDVYVGDLWLMAGQSNMEGCAFMDKVPKPHPLVRCFTMARRWVEAREPLHLKPESPDPVHGGKSLSVEAAEKLRHKTRKGAGVGLHFGRLMLARTGVPQGFIATAHGGTTMAQWDPALRHLCGKSLYGSMLLSLRAAGQPLAGVLWYQGESEALPKLAHIYTRRMQRLVAAVRRDLAQPRLPWLIVQIGRFIRDHEWTDTWPNAVSWNAIQEQQRLLPEFISRCAVVPAIDLELDDRAHIGSDGFVLLGKRLAEIALQLAFRDPKAKPAITLRSIRRTTAVRPHGPSIEVQFANVAGTLSSKGPIHGFTLTDPKGCPISLIYRVELCGNRAILHLAIPAAKDLRLCYGYGLDPACSLIDARGMAVPVFGPVSIN